MVENNKKIKNIDTDTLLCCLNKSFKMSEVMMFHNGTKSPPTTFTEFACYNNVLITFCPKNISSCWLLTLPSSSQFTANSDMYNCNDCEY
ncbi:hypothetical protein EXN66_Car004882 [Channa argus]|uniref:Uncharacterized protein n=1 Tax=Channa argus TaxID=215402 RepID=A0A6G1PFY1_CHAAH|nr:hypothetical protein EXN66_Car004882 [Channa argus]